MQCVNLKDRVLIGYRYYEQIVVLILLGLLMIVVFYATVGLRLSVALMM